MKHRIQIALIVALGALFLLFFRPWEFVGGERVSGQDEGEMKQNAKDDIGGASSQPQEESPYAGKVVVIDPGHGGKDPGKVGEAGLSEKDVNLQIAIVLQGLLEEEGITVIMTRTEDISLGDVSASNQKMEDLKERLRLIDESKAELTVSIHQNSFGDRSVCGPQVFYCRGSEKGERAATILQEELNTGIGVGKERDRKEDNSYYLLKHSASVVVIAECAFLSNPEEEALLMDAAYRERVAEALKKGILRYLDETGNDESEDAFFSGFLS